MSASIISDSNFTDVTITHKFTQMRKLYLVPPIPAAVANGLVNGRSLHPQAPETAPRGALGSPPGVGGVPLVPLRDICPGDTRSLLPCTSGRGAAGGPRAKLSSSQVKPGL